MRTASWVVTDFLDKTLELLRNDTEATELRLYFYGVTSAGWQRIRDDAKAWMRRGKRKVVAYIGTDHALTDAKALTKMRADGVKVRMMRNYTGVYHPKLIWFYAAKSSTLLSGSNNLTEDGLANNIEFSTITTIGVAKGDLRKWHDAVHDASEEATAALIKSYEQEKQTYGPKVTASTGGAFTWSKRTSGRVKRKARAAAGKVLVLEVMPRETGQEGKQVQIPIEAATKFFGLGGRGDSFQLQLRNADSGDERELTLTHNNNDTARLSIRELGYDSRPCVLVFERKSKAKREFEIEIVSQAIDPDRYKALIASCGQNPPSRRWEIL